MTNSTLAALARYAYGLRDFEVVGGPDWIGPFAGRIKAQEPNLSLPSFTAALRDQFGLRLEPTRGPVDVLVVDSVHQPAAN
jgi:hypothetical protein